MRDKRQWFPAALALLGVLASFTLLGQRFSMEQGDRMTAAAFPVSDLAVLAQESGEVQEAWRSALEDAGVQYWIQDGVGYDGDGTAVFTLPSVPAEEETLTALIEDETRTTMYAPEGMDLSKTEEPVVKALYLYPDYLNRATAEEAEGIQDLLFRGVTDRGLRLLILRPFTTAEGELVTDSDVYADCLAGLTQRLADRGIDFGGALVPLKTPAAQPMLLFLASLLPLLAGLWLLERFLPLGRAKLPLLILGVLGDGAAFWLLPELSQRGWMLLAAIFLPCVVINQLAQWMKSPPEQLTKRPFLGSALLATGGIVGGGLAGGLVVAALMTSRVYLLGAAVFSGVKLALLLPLAFAGVLFLLALNPRLPQGPWRGWLIGGGAAVLVALLVFRSGDAGMSSLEASLRTFLEQTLYARPRSKELLIAVPCIPLLVLAVRKGCVLLTLLFALLASLECVSVVNTFCHAVSPLRVSLIRTGLGVAGGLVIGFLLALLLWGLLQLWKKPNPSDSGLKEA